MSYSKIGKTVVEVPDVICDILSFLFLFFIFLVEANGLLRIHFKGLDSY